MSSVSRLGDFAGSVVGPASAFASSARALVDGRERRRLGFGDWRVV